MALLQYMIEEGQAEPEGDYGSEADSDAAAQELDEREAYRSESQFFLHLGVDGRGDCANTLNTCEAADGGAERWPREAGLRRGCQT